ncbi:MAG: nucleotidyl transferase AbiEii/AbiGii toxin family protein [Giesbergeria sp.]
MSNWDRRYLDRVRLLVETLPTIAQETRFALKGGTAINLFEDDLPRLSVDIDLAWLPTVDYEQDLQHIGAALERLAQRLREAPLRLQVQDNQGAASTRLIASRGRARIQIETTPVMRGSVHPVRRMRVQPGVERDFGFAEMQVLDHADLYAGKMAAALSRQHPRDLFDMGRLLDRAGIDERLWRTFLVYVTCSPKPAAELLAPNEPVDFEMTFERHFKGMTATSTTAAELLEARRRLLARIAELLDASSQAFLWSVEQEAPDFDLIGMPQAAGLPAVRRKLGNLAQRSAAKRESDRQQLTETIDKTSQMRGTMR